MIENLRQFQFDLTKFYEVAVPQKHLEYQCRLADRLFQLITERNSTMRNHPYDTGWSVRNWQASNNTYKTSVRGKYPGEGNTTNLAPFNLQAVLSKAKPFGIIWIYNNVPYIEALENGHSTQAPIGMLDGAFHDLQAYINGGMK